MRHTALSQGAHFTTMASAVLIVLTTACAPLTPQAPPTTAPAPTRAEVAATTEPAATSGSATRLPPGVQALPVRRGSIAETLSLTGRVSGMQELRLSFPIAARLARVPAEVGAEVEEGQVLAEVDTASMEADRDAAAGRISAAEAATARVRTPLEARLARLQDTLAQITAGPPNSDRILADAAVTSARGSVDKAEGDLARLLAPPNPADIRIAEQQVTSASIGLQRAQDVRDRLSRGPDPDALRKAESDLAGAQNALSKATADLDFLQRGPDQLQVNAAERAVSIAQSELAAIESQLGSGNQPKISFAPRILPTFTPVPGDFRVPSSAATTAAVTSTPEPVATISPTPVQPSSPPVEEQTGSLSQSIMRAMMFSSADALTGPPAPDTVVQQAKNPTATPDPKKKKKDQSNDNSSGDSPLTKAAADTAKVDRIAQLTAARQKAEFSLQTALENLQKVMTPPPAWQVDAARRVVESAQRTADSAQEKLTAVKSGPDQLTLASADSDVDAAQGKLEKAQSSVDQLRAGVSNDQLNAARRSLEAARLALSSAEAKRTERLSATNAAPGQVADTQAKIDALRQILDGAAVEPPAQAATDSAGQSSAGQSGADTIDRDVAAFVRANQALETERTQLDALNASLSATQLKAPARGIVSGLDGAPNTSVTAGRPVVYLATSEERVVRATVAERDVSRVVPGQLATIQLVSGSSDKKLNATIVGLSASDNLREAILKLDEPEPSISMGNVVQALITIRRNDNALLVPQRAIRIVSGRRYVDVVEGSSQRRVEVELGIVNANDVEITSGLQEGQVVLVGA